MYNTIYPKLSTLISAEILPDELDFIKEALTKSNNSLFNKIFYTNLQIRTGDDNTSGTYFLEILIDEIALELAGFKLKLLPSSSSSNSAIPLTLSYQWEILKYIRGFDISTFTEAPSQFFDLFINVQAPADRELIDLSSSTVVSGATPLTSLATFLNTKLPSSSQISLPLSTNRDTALTQISDKTTTANLDLKSEIFSEYIQKNNSPEEQKNKVEVMLRPVFGGDPLEAIKRILIPRIWASIEVGMSLEIPRSVLKPMKLDNTEWKIETDETKKVELLFDIGIVNFSTESGIYFDDNIAVTMKAPYTRAQIGSTPFNIGFSHASYEMIPNGTSKRSRITIETSNIGFPAIWKKQAGYTQPEIFGKNIVIDSERGFSGLLGLDANNTLKYSFANNLSISLTQFSIQFVEGNVVSSSIFGTMTIPIFKVNNTPVVFNIKVEFYKDGFYVKVFASNTTVIDNSKLKLTLDGFEIGERASIWKIGIACGLITKEDFPIVGKFIPSLIKLNQFSYDTSPDLRFAGEIGWKGGKKVTINQDTGLTARFPVNLGNDKFKIEALALNARKSSSGGLEANITIEGAQMNFKAAELRVDGLGFKLDFQYVGENGSIGPFNVDMGIKPPNGIGIKIDASKLKGGGYLYFNDGEYIGAISLNLDTGKKKLEINDIGILTTKVPNGKAGYSFLIIASVEGLQIQLGMGFVLDAIGGMLGLHRTMDPEAFREGLKQGKMDSVLFPRDILNNIHRIVSDIQCLYPIKQDQFLIAPMARITWGTPSLIFIDLALVIEIGNPFRLALLGNVYTALPDKDSDIIRLKVAFFGIIDFDKKQIYFDASIYDSKIGFLTIEGDMCVRIFYGEQKEFLMSVGGFHPQFKPAANLNVRSDMRRITVRLLSDNPSLIIQSYIALTSNTLQFGAKADFNFDAGPCNIRAGLALDVLIQFSPFYFIAELHAYAGVYIGGGCLFAIDIYGKLSGPTPWNFVGKAQFDLCFFISVTVRLNITWGDNPPPALPNVSIMPKLLQDLNKLENWTTELPNQKNQYVKLRANTTSKVLIDPMGKLKVSQTTVPLDIKDIKKFGNNQSLDGKAGFKINSVKVGATAVPHLTKAYDSFAASQFFEFNDDDKLRLPSYQNYVSGFIAGSSDIKMGLAVEADTDYEYTIIDTEVAKNTANTQSKFTTNIASKKFLAGNAAGQSIQARDHAQKSLDIGRISLAQTQYIVSSTTAMGRYTGTQNYTTEGEAYQVMNALITANPNLESKLKVLAA